MTCGFSSGKTLSSEHESGLHSHVTCGPRLAGFEDSPYYSRQTRASSASKRAKGLITCHVMSQAIFDEISCFSLSCSHVFSRQMKRKAPAISIVNIVQMSASLCLFAASGAARKLVNMFTIGNKEN